MKVLIITDSLGLPRESPEKLYDFQCWPYKLIEDKEYTVSTFSVRGLSTSDILGEYQSILKMYTPEIVVVQVGIVDCAPRILSRKHVKLVSLIPGVRGIVRHLLSKHRKFLSKFISRTYVNIDEFKLNLEKILNLYKDASVIFVPIFGASIYYENQVPGIKKNVDIYNGVIKKHNFVDIDCEDASNYTMSDHHHLNEQGHLLVYNALKNKLIKTGNHDD